MRPSSCSYWEWEIAPVPQFPQAGAGGTLPAPPHPNPPPPSPLTPPPPCRPPGRFQQVQALAATADAFFCLYSYVSRTPLQRIAPPGPSRPYRDIPDSPELRGARPGPAPPGERLKRAVSSLCLYTGGDRDTSRGSRGATLGPPSAPGAWGLRKDAGGAPEGWRRDGDAGTVQRGPSPRPAPVGTAAGTARGHPERSCPHGRGLWGPGGAPCPARAAQGGTRDARPDAAAPWGNVTVSPTLGPLSPHASRVGVTPEPPVGLGPEGDSGLGSWCHPGATARAGGHRAGLQPPGRVPSPLAPRGAAESFELEEVRRRRRRWKAPLAGAGKEPEREMSPELPRLLRFK